jgi:hypothetical protein
MCIASAVCSGVCVVLSWQIAATTSSAFSAPSIFKRGRRPAVASMSSSVKTFLAFAAFCALVLRAAAARGLLLVSPPEASEVEAAGSEVVAAGGEAFWAKLKPEDARSTAPSTQHRVEELVRMSALARISHTHCFLDKCDGVVRFSGYGGTARAISSPERSLAGSPEWILRIAPPADRFSEGGSAVVGAGLVFNRAGRGRLAHTGLSRDRPNSFPARSGVC